MTRDDLKYEEMLGHLAPCGLMCGNCLAFEGSAICKAARELGQGLGDNFAVYAGRLGEMNPVLKQYEPFREVLDFLVQGSCSGCRNQGCLFTACGLADCVRSHSVDFCFECIEFPCDHHGMPSGLDERWRVNNEHMRDVGVGAYYEKMKEKPRYP